MKKKPQPYSQTYYAKRLLEALKADAVDGKVMISKRELVRRVGCQKGSLHFMVNKLMREGFFSRRLFLKDSRIAAEYKLKAKMRNLSNDR